MSWRNHQKVADAESMSNLKSQINKLKEDMEKYNKSFEVIVFDNYNELRVRGNELLDALSCAIASDYDNRIVKELKEHTVVSYSGSGNMPQLIMSILKSNQLQKV